MSSAMDEGDDPTCKRCGQKLTLIGMLPQSGAKPRTGIYKCTPCVRVAAIPPLRMSSAEYDAR
jgi:hypothetical protein